MSATLVRVRENAPPHGRACACACNQPEVKRRYDVLPVDLPPIQPDETWTCGTPFVWRVSRAWLVEQGIACDEGNVCVCWHQIEVD